MTSFAGRWYSTFGPLDLQQDGDRVWGTYTYGASEGTIEGNVTDHRLRFRYQEPTTAGEGWFDLLRPGKFQGRWRPLGSTRWGDWVGTRGFEGVWQSSFGRLRLVETKEGVRGFYEGAGSSTIHGRFEGDRLVFRYQEPTTTGEGWFELAPDGTGFHGEWKAEGSEAWQTWEGKRLLPMPGVVWLVVLEAHWQRSLQDNEYSFGSMLKEYFARLHHVAVRHRFFDDAAGLERWCRELLYCPEPAIVMLASHGTPEGLTVGGTTISTEEAVKLLGHADNILLLHFSACLTMADGAEGSFVKGVRQAVSFPISGYTTSVDWGGSAIIEFQYLDMILAKGLTPAEAAARLVRLVGYAGDEAPADSPYPGAGFRFHPPEGFREEDPYPEVERETFLV